MVVVQNAEKALRDPPGNYASATATGKNTRLVIVDINSQDRTIEIIERLAYPQNYISLISLDNENSWSKFSNGIGLKTMWL